eukprot:TRINITY_DN4106_c0_g1_i1.p1 TRINITY_DN4106_c0_g1~~TRINITY_DN4106_c0_g1_i1.p1  ORF type:complete len:149 (+),score=24.24 TRINITY_DN4106_c0_g1_i1:68-514(+)
MAAPNPRRVRFGDACIIEIPFRMEFTDDCKAMVMRTFEEDYGNDCTPLSRSKAHDKHDPKASIHAVSLLHHNEHSTDFKTSSLGERTDEERHDGNEEEEDDLSSLIDVFVRYDSARTKGRSLCPRMEKKVELDLRKSPMWSRRNKLKQ